MRHRRLLVYGEMDVAVIDGSSIWLVSTVDALARAGCEVVMLLRFPPRSDRLLRSLRGRGGITIVDPSTHPRLRRLASLDSRRGLDADDAAAAIELLAASQRIDAVVVRGSTTARRLARCETLRGRLWPYLTDIPQSAGGLDADQRAWLGELADASAAMLCQTEGIRALLETAVRETAGRCELWPPIAAVPHVRAAAPPAGVGSAAVPLRLGYMGKFAPLWNTLEMTALPALLADRGIQATLDLAGDKVHRAVELPGWCDAMREALATAPGTTWHGGLPRDEAIQRMARAHVGLAWRAPGLDASLELSTKLLEYGALGLPAVVNRTVVHEELLGRDYPLFVDETWSAVDALERAVRRPDELRLAADRVEAATRAYRADAAVPRVRRLVERILPEPSAAVARPPRIFSRIAQPTSIFSRIAGVVRGDLAAIPRTLRRGGRRPIRLVVAGHDLKFIEKLAARIAGTGAFELRWDRWPTSTTHDRRHSAACLAWADVVLCEWCAKNAIWYSRNLRAGQRLVVRLHRYELERRWPLDVAHDRVDRLVCVSRHTGAKAAGLLPALAGRMVVVPNWVDVEHLDRPKLAGADCVLGMIGASVMRKGLMRALDILERVRAEEPAFRLEIKSELPWNRPGTWNREDERAYAIAALERIAASDLLREAVTFVEPGSDVATWLRRIGWVLSTSDDESFHLAPAEGAASGAVPVVLDWEGAAEVHGADWTHGSPDRAARWIVDRHRDGSWRAEGERARHHVGSRYALDAVTAAWAELLAGVTDGRVPPEPAHRPVTAAFAGSE